MKSVLADLSTFDWEGDQPLYRPFRRSVIYEMHVAGFTRHPNSGVTPANRGTYLGVVEKIPYLQELGVTALNFCPCISSMPGTLPRKAPTTGATTQYPSSLLILPTVPPRTRLTAWMSFEPW